MAIGDWPAGTSALACDQTACGWDRLVLSVFLVSHAVRDAWIENRLDSAGLPVPGTFLATVGTLETATEGLDRISPGADKTSCGAVPTGPKVIFASGWFNWECIDK